MSRKNIANTWALKLDGLTTEQVLNIVRELVCNSNATCKKCADAGIRRLCYRADVGIATDDEKMKLVQGLIEMSPYEILYHYLGIDIFER